VITNDLDSSNAADTHNDTLQTQCYPDLAAQGLDAIVMSPTPGHRDPLSSSARQTPGDSLTAPAGMASGTDGTVHLATGLLWMLDELARRGAIGQ
jgi:hypothetical protein